VIHRPLLHINILFFAVILLTRSPLAQAAGAFVLNPALTGAQVETTRKGSTVKDTVILLNVGAGTVLNDGMYLGLKYLSDGVSRSMDGASSSSKTEMRAYGLSAGYMSKANFTMVLSWLVNPEHATSDSADETLLKGGSGYMLDFGWRTKVNQSWSMGPQVTYTAMTYKKVSVNGTESDLEGGTWGDTSLYPYLGLWLFF